MSCDRKVIKITEGGGGRISTHLFRSRTLRKKRKVCPTLTTVAERRTNSEGGVIRHSAPLTLLSMTIEGFDPEKYEEQFERWLQFTKKEVRRVIKSKKENVKNDTKH